MNLANVPNLVLSINLYTKSHILIDGYMARAYAPKGKNNNICHVFSLSMVLRRELFSRWQKQQLVVVVTKTDRHEDHQYFCFPTRGHKLEHSNSRILRLLNKHP
jgi:hypothetical protein